MTLAALALPRTSLKTQPKLSAKTSLLAAPKRTLSRAVAQQLPQRPASRSATLHKLVVDQHLSRRSSPPTSKPSIPVPGLRLLQRLTYCRDGFGSNKYRGTDWPRTWARRTVLQRGWFRRSFPTALPGSLTLPSLGFTNQAAPPLLRPATPTSQLLRLLYPPYQHCGKTTASPPRRRTVRTSSPAHVNR